MTRHSRKPHRQARRRTSRLDSAAADVREVTLTVPADRVGMLRKYAQRISRNRPAQREEVLWHLRHHAPTLVQRYGVSMLALFGSVAQGRSRRESDVDLLVEFEPGRPTGMLEFVELKGWLESILGRPVDLVTPANLKARIRERILREAIRVL
ncbi:nucleotidyltransferase family protein [Novispirillum sp. DQ9]|uniref:nucleotidyltransferase family protein n=1 Tax=Novispirillum sp. DQ9 TaxID=3398612 RepID=UPI003C7A3430